MANNGAALLGGLLIGGLVVGAAMSAENKSKHHHRHHSHHVQYKHQPQQIVACTYCICGAQMVQGTIQQGVAKCNNLNCQRLLTGTVMYYCPNGGNVQQHRNGFFYCTQCALKQKGGVQVIQRRSSYPAKQNVQQTYTANNKPIVVKQGYMSKRGNWLSTAYRKRYFKLWSNKKMAYFTHPGASYTKGYADFTKIKKMEKKGNHGFEVITTEREWSFLCQSQVDRDDWFRVIQSICTEVKPQVIMKQAQYVPAPQEQPINKELQPGMVGYNVGDMYGNNNNEEKAPPPAFSNALAPSAPPEDDIVPSAPPFEDQNEGAYTGQ